MRAALKLPFAFPATDKQDRPRPAVGCRVEAFGCKKLNMEGGFESLVGPQLIGDLGISRSFEIVIYFEMLDVICR